VGTEQRSLKSRIGRAAAFFVIGVLGWLLVAALSLLSAIPYGGGSAFLAGLLLFWPFFVLLVTLAIVFADRSPKDRGHNER